MQLGVFYFGRWQGWLAASLTAVAYLIFALGVPPFVTGPPAVPLTAAFNTTLFALIAAVLIHTLGSFRERMDALRMYCKVAERGEGAMIPQLGVERWSDDLTLPARSFQSMHVRLAEQLGSDPLTGCMNRRATPTRWPAPAEMSSSLFFLIPAGRARSRSPSGCASRSTSSTSVLREHR